MELRANAASQSDSPATGAATFPAQHTTIEIGIRSSCCSFLATQTMVCSKMKDKIWQKARDKKHFIRDEIYWWQRERTLMGHAHILWVLLSATRIAVRALNCRLFPRPIWHSGTGTGQAAMLWRNVSINRWLAAALFRRLPTGVAE